MQTPHIRRFVFHDMNAVHRALSILRDMFPSDYPATVATPPWYSI